MKYCNFNIVFCSRLAALLSLGLLLTACQSSSHYSTMVDNATLDEIQQALLQSQNTQWQDEAALGQAPTEILQSFIPELEINSPTQALIEERFNVVLNGDMDVREFFSMLTDGTQYSIVIHPDVSGSISALDLKNVTLEETLDQVTTLYGFVVNKSGNIYQILPGGLQTKIYKIDYLNVARNGSSNMQIVASGISQGGQNGGSNGNYSGMNGGGFGGFANQGMNSAMGGGQGSGGSGQTTTNSGGASISTTSEADYWTTLEATILSIINAQQSSDTNTGDSRSVVISPHTGLIIVRAFPSELEMVDTFLKASQLILQKQVILEAKILEVELKEGFQAGIDLMALSDINNGNEIAFSSSFIGDQLNGVGSPFAVGYKATDFNGVIRLLETQGNVQVISSPRISTLNNQKAVFKVGSEQYFLTNASSTSFGSGDTSTTNQNTSLQPFFSGIALDVTPQISDEGDIILHIHPILSQVQEDIRVIGGEEFPLANSTTRESDSVARARNGEVIVISGLMQTRSRGQEAGMPGVRKIPLLGNAFEQKQSESIKTELVILLRAIVDEEGAMNNLINDHMQGFEDLRYQLIK